MSDIQELELSIEQAKKLVERKNMILKLTSNREFKKVVLDGYFVDEAARLASISADPLQQEYWDQIHLCIQGISLFRQFMQTGIRMGQVAEQELREQNELLDELQAGEDE